ncbi:class I SAM-dependent methyltransferase [Streptomyces sp. NPDC051909]|uniref:class I SAM-dependent methyltransferase n=1 Tax=Streptomyces sp. NPDC051909 TaxID=3154944 RepID=UPI00343BDACE
MSDQNAVESFQDAWEAYWGETSGRAASGYESGSMWDVDVERAVAKDYNSFQRFMDTDLPLIDLGCGRGLQTQYLARHYGTVLGADVSTSAIEMASREYGAPGLEYRVLDALDSEAIRDLHGEFGDVNLYIRTLLHFIQPDSRRRFAESVETLLGERGTLYLCELGPTAPEYFQSWIQRNGMPAQLERVMRAGVQPGSVTPEQVRELFPDDRFETVLEGHFTSEPVSKTLAGENSTAAAELWSPPGYFVILRPRK